MNTGVILSISKNRLSGTVVQDSDGSTIDWVDSTPPAGLLKEDRVQYTLTTDDPPVAQNLEALPAGVVLDGGITEGNQIVAAGTSLIITNGAVVNGNITNDGGVVSISGGVTIDWRLNSGNGGRLTVFDATVTGKVIVDENEFFNTENTQYDKNVVVSDTPSLRL